MIGLLGCTAPVPTVPPDPKNPWETSAVTFQDAKITVQKVSYRSNGLKVFGQVCRPNGNGPYPILVYNHGGFGGLGNDWNGDICKSYAGQGYVVMASAYRGEDGSEGRIEVCQGEVDDVLRLLEIGRALPYARSDRAAMLGFSHGGCITTRAVQRGAPVQVMIDFFGPTDWASEFAFVQQQISQTTDPGTKAAYQGLLDIVRNAVGGSPTQIPDAYAARSPAWFSSDLATFAGSVLVIHGVMDALVPVAQSCDLVKRVGGFNAYHLSTTQALLVTAPTRCEASSLLWSTADPRGLWDGKRSLMIYDGYGHGNGDGSIPQTVLTDAIGFLAKKFPPN